MFIPETEWRLNDPNGRNGAVIGYCGLQLVLAGVLIVVEQEADRTVIKHLRPKAGF